MTQTAMCWGLACGPGWYPLIDTLCRCIQSYIDDSRQYRVRALLFNRAIKRALNGDDSSLIRYHSYGGEITDFILRSVEMSIKENTMRSVPIRVRQVEATQVKEKYGTLRFYTAGGDDFTDGLIRMAEAISGITCEECGAPGKLKGDYWVYTACEAHTKVVDSDDTD